MQSTNKFGLLEEPPAAFEWTIDAPDAIVLLPMLDLKELWGPTYAGMNRVIQPMLHAAGRANVDPARVYVVGHSMSAHAAWNLALGIGLLGMLFNVLSLPRLILAYRNGAMRYGVFTFERAPPGAE